jgi:TolA-binding protein
MMKKLLILILMGLAFNSQALYAEEQSDTLSFWKKLRNKLESFTPQKKVTSTNATGGVRGAPMASDDIYWKGEVTAQTIDADEFEAFQKALASVDSGDKQQTQTAFSEFIKKYPDSSLRKDADQALALSTTP